MAVALACPQNHSAALIKSASPSSAKLSKAEKQLEFPSVFCGRELTRKDRRLSSGLHLIDRLLGGGIVRGRISEFTGSPGSGRTTLAASFAASATRRGEVIAWIDSARTFDPASMAEAGVDLQRMLWASFPGGKAGRGELRNREPNIRRRIVGPESRIIKAAEMVLEAGGFGLVVIDFGDSAGLIPQSAALRIARSAERGGVAVIVLARHRMCGTFSALSLALNRLRPCFSRLAPGSPALFDGIEISARVSRNKLGATGGRVVLHALLDGAPEADEGKDRNLPSPSPWTEERARGRVSRITELAAHRPAHPRPLLCGRGW